MPAPRKPSARVRQKRLQVRRDILDAALRILRERGVDAVTLAAVSGELGMTKPALYHYFPSKDALLSAVVTALIEAEVKALTAAVEAEEDRHRLLGTLIRAFHGHHVRDFAGFRFLYSQSQLLSAMALGLDPATLRKEVNPRTRGLFDLLESRLAGRSRSSDKRRQLRRKAYTAWTSALGLVTMLSVADNAGDPLLHGEAELLDTLADVFDAAV